MRNVHNNSEQISPATARDTSFLEGGGELGSLMRAYEWERTPLGHPAVWPRSLKTAVRIMLTSRQPIWLGWGAELTYLYNDPYKTIIGGKHPQALGRPFSEVWSEIWDVVGPMADTVMTRDEGTYVEEQLLIMQRHGYEEETYYTFSYSPVPNDDGGPGGLICANTDDTGRVIGERQLSTLSDLASRIAGARSRQESCRLGIEALGGNTRDIPFAMIYLEGRDGVPELVAATAGTQALLDPSLWPINEAMRSLETRSVELVDLRLAPNAFPVGAWNRPATLAAVLPIGASGQTTQRGALVVGLNPFRQFDERYRSFLELVARQLAAGIANAHAYEEERERAEALAQLDEAKTAFFSNVSHEFRTPLTLMLGPLEDLLAREHELSQSDREQVQLAHRNALRLLRLVNTLLDFSRVEAGRMQASYEAVDLPTYTAELASVFRSTLERAGLRFEVDCSPVEKGEPAFVDRRMWEKIVFNLLSNAFKFTFQGSITIRVLRDQKNGVFLLNVVDTGIGIPAADLPRMFERFHRVEGAKGRSFEGSGIGLALVQELVKLHGGKVSVDSELGRGTAFTVSLPAGSAHLPPERIESSPPKAGVVRGEAYIEEMLRWLPETSQVRSVGDTRPSRPRVLLADDNADMRDYAAKLLADAYEVTVVEDGETALATARELTFDLVVSDVMMPKLDGFGLLAALRADARTAAVPVMLLSARAGEEARLEGIGQGADDYLVKPFSARELLVRVGSLLATARMRREASEAIAQTAAQFKTLFNDAPLGMYVVDADFCISAVNPVALPVFGDIPDLIGRSFEEVIRILWPADYAQEVIERFRHTIETGEPWIERERIEHRKDRGVTEYYAWQVHRIVLANGRYGAVCYFRDISEMVLAREALREEAQALEILNRIGATLAGELDLERTVQAVTDAATEVSGAQFGAFFYNVTDTAGESYMLFALSGAPRAAFEKFGMPRNTAVFAPTFAGQGVVRVDDITQDERYGKNAPNKGMPRGHLPVKSYLAAPVVSRSGEVIGGLFFGHERAGVFNERAEHLVIGIAAQAAVAIDNARLYQQRLQLIEQLREEDRRKDEFLATLSHELRNPLAPLRNSLHFLRLSDKEKDGIASIHDMMERQLNYLVRLVDDLLEISRISRGTFELRKERVDVATILKSAVETSEPLIHAGGHTLDLSLPSETLWLEGDPIRLAQVLANLINNAAKYTPAPGRIAIEVRREQEEALLIVRDSGVGISAEALPRIFDMFNRGDQAGPDAQTGSQTGLGIGLALARRLAEMHGGNITGTSAGPGLGSEFIIRLPLIAGPAGEASDTSDLKSGEDEETSRISPVRILVVDDNRDAAQTLSMVLETLGANAQLAHDGPSALEAVKHLSPHVVLLDIGMPGMDGYEVARRIRAGNAGSNPVLVALTGWGQESDKRRAIQAGFDHHLTKPVDFAILENLLISIDAQD